MECPGHQRGAFGVDPDGAFFPAVLIADTDVLIPDGSQPDGAALGCLLGQALDGFGGEVA
ncbi:hypothetical protein [Schaalia sp. JY-X159]|uniref:hypothetical protein n=1 Tax=Schaalia sp. JY-X159 TaxID=2758575 RepID=UPI001CB6FE00|nr:hypothetical protein [Schaalia sp. JY-X159]